MRRTRTAVAAALVMAGSCLMASNEEAEARPTVASYYGYELAGSPTATGEPFAPLGYTAAHKTLPLGSIVEVYNPATGASVVVRINDRGPYIEGREFDLSLGAAQAIGLEQQGVGYVEVY